MLQADDYDVRESLLPTEDEEGEAEGDVLSSTNTMSDDRVPGRNGFACSICVVILMVVTNIAAFYWLSVILCSFTHMCEPNYRRHKYQPDDNDGDEIDRSVRMEVILLVAQIVVNLLMIWYVCIKPSKAARRTLRAGVAVFRICNRPRAHDEETLVPFATLMRQGLKSVWSAISAGLAVSARLCLLSALAFLPFHLLCSKDDEGGCVLTQETTLAILLVYALVLWSYLWRSVLSQRDFFGENQYLDSIEASANIETPEEAAEKAKDAAGVEDKKSTELSILVV